MDHILGILSGLARVGLNLDMPEPHNALSALWLWRVHYIQYGRLGLPVHILHLYTRGLMNSRILQGVSHLNIQGAANDRGLFDLKFVTTGGGVSMIRSLFF